MIIQCQNCGAPLQVDGTRTFVDCRYCGLSNKVKKSVTLFTHEPADWQPPVTWTPEMQRSVSRGAAVAGGAAAGGVGLAGCISALVLVLGLGIGALVFHRVNRAVEGATGGAGIFPSALSWNGSAPFSCGANSDVRIEGVTANLPGQTAITASLNCSVTLVDSHITAARGIDASGNGVTRLENSTLDTTGPGIVVSMNKNLVLVNSRVTAGGVGVEASMNSEITIDGGSVQGSPVAVRPGRHGMSNNGGQLIDQP